jgi:TPR repeat protein
LRIIAFSTALALSSAGAHGVDLPRACSAEQLDRPAAQAEEAGTWAWRLGKLNAQVKADPDNPDLRLAQTEAAIRLLTLAAIAESRAQTERAGKLRSLTQRALDDARLDLDQRAADGDRAALTAQVESLWYGVLHPQDAPRACALLAPIADSELSTLARYRLAQCVQQHDPQASLAIMRQSAAEGHPAAAEALALLCRYGREPDIDCLLEWGCVAIGAGRPRLAPILGSALIEQGGTESTALAARLLRLGAAAADPASMTALADLLDSGRLGHTDPLAARSWYERAADLGWPAAIEALERLETTQRRR